MKNSGKRLFEVFCDQFSINQRKKFNVQRIEMKVKKETEGEEENLNNSNTV